MPNSRNQINRLLEITTPQPLILMSSSFVYPSDEDHRMTEEGREPAIAQ